MSTAGTCPISGLTRIILATDGSEYSEKALVEAVSLAKTCGTMLSAVSVVETNPEYAALAPKAIEKAESEAKEFLDAVKECAEKEGVEVNTVILHGQDVATVLVEHAKKADADMIVMGRQGRKKGLKKLFMGSVTSSLISHAHCKVLVVP